MNTMDIFKDILSQAFYFPRAILLAIPMFLAWLFWIDNRGHIKDRIASIKGKWWIIAFFIYLSFIMVSTVMGRKEENPFGYFVSHIFPGKNTKVWEMNIENMLMFIPYSFLYLQAYKPQKPWKSTVQLITLTSLFIEACQLFFWLGVFQLSDIIYNIIGGLLGIGIWKLWWKIFPSKCG